MTGARSGKRTLDEGGQEAVDNVRADIVAGVEAEAKR